MNLDEDEILNSYSLTINEIKNYISKGIIKDLKTYACLTYLLLNVSVD